MTKIRKLKKKKVFRYGVNRKRLRNKLNKVPKIQKDQLKEAWEDGKSTKSNLANMGLAYDTNKALKIPSVKDLLRPDDPDVEMGESSGVAAEKQYVADSLAAEANKPKARLFRLPNNQLHWVTYLLDKYGEDYKAMARDNKNHNQDTWKQIRAKIKQFKGIPEQFSEYLASRKKATSSDTPMQQDVQEASGAEPSKEQEVV